LVLGEDSIAQPYAQVVTGEEVGNLFGLPPKQPLVMFYPVSCMQQSISTHSGVGIFEENPHMDLIVSFLASGSSDAQRCKDGRCAGAGRAKEGL
jgi:hypothetical protein